MPVHNAGYISRPGDLSGVKGVSAEPEPQAQAQARNCDSDSPAHNALILSKFSAICAAVS